MSYIINFIHDGKAIYPTIQRYDIGATVTSGDVFATAPEPEEIERGPIPDPCPFTWPNVIAKSGIEEHLKALIAARTPRS